VGGHGQREAEEAALAEARKQAFEDRKRAQERARHEPMPPAIVVDTRLGAASPHDQDAAAGPGEPASPAPPSLAAAVVSQDLCALTASAGEASGGGGGGGGGGGAADSGPAGGLHVLTAPHLPPDSAVQEVEECIEAVDDDDAHAAAVLARIEAAEEEDDAFGVMLGRAAREGPLSLPAGALTA